MHSGVRASFVGDQLLHHVEILAESRGPLYLLPQPTGVPFALQTSDVAREVVAAGPEAVVVAAAAVVRPSHLLLYQSTLQGAVSATMRTCARAHC